MQGEASWLGSLLPFILLFVLMYFILIRPQQVQQRKRREMLGSLKNGERIVTVGGIHGTVTELRDDTVDVRISDKVEIRLQRSGIGQVLRGD